MRSITYSPHIEDAIDRISALLTGRYAISRRAIALLVLSGDEEIMAVVAREADGVGRAISKVVQATRERFDEPLEYLLALQQRVAAKDLVRGLIAHTDDKQAGWGDRLSRAMIRPLTGIPILLLTLLIVYWTVGVFGAQTLVDWLEGTLFEGALNPWFNRIASRIIPWEWLISLFVGEYGVLTLGVRYAVAIILPIVGTFFLVFAVIEDSGYLPRLALLIDRLFKRIGLNGRAVIPMVLGFGCDTMATIVTRTLETRREKLISTLLLALAIPCSAQLGVIFAILAGYPGALGIWALAVGGIFVLVGFLMARLTPGEKPHFYMELPPLRRPLLSNVLVKTYTRMEWYLREVIPLFLLASVLLWLGQLTGVFGVLVRALEPAVRLLGLPDEAALAFLFGFFRRDYGAAGLYDIQGMLSVAQLTVAAVTLTLFVPCIAQFSVMVKERGARVAFAVIAFIFPFAFFFGWALNRVLSLLGLLQ